MPNQNPFLQAKFLYEKVDRRQGLDHLNEYFRSKLGELAFFDFDERVFTGHFLAEEYSSLELAVDHHLYSPQSYGSCDFLAMRYGIVFKALWDLMPGQPWILSFLHKDFRVVPVDLLYTDEAENFRDEESVALVWQTLVQAAEQGWINDNHKFLSGRISWSSLEIIEDKESIPLLGLKEKILTELPAIMEQSAYKDPDAFWAKEYEQDASKLVNYTIYQLFGNYQYDAHTKSMNWKGMQKMAPTLVHYFHQGFKAMTLAEQTNVMHYAGFNAKEPEKWIENFLKVLQNKRSMLDFVEEFKDVENQLN